MDKPQPKKPVNRLHNIRRYEKKENNSYAAWLVCVQRTHHETKKPFTDAAYGGKHKALQAAISYRDELLAEIGTVEHLLWYKTIVRSNNTSGITGVYRREKIDKRSPNSLSLYWEAFWRNEYGARCSRCFSITLYGEFEAKQMAIAEREYQLKRVCAIKESYWLIPHNQKVKKTL